MDTVLLKGAEALQFIQQPPTLSQSDDGIVAARTEKIIARIKATGDTALKEIMAELGDPIIEGFCLTPAAVDEAIALLPAETLALFKRAAENIERFASAIAKQAQPFEQTLAGVTTGVQWQAVERVVCYVPSGRYPLPSTALMTTITAKAAGVKEIILTSPRLSAEIIAAAKIGGATKIYQLGGAQAVAAFAMGTASIAKADMIVGPGNAYVTEAKRQLQGIIGIDMLAGPSEVAIIADDSADALNVAWDMLAQAEHDPDACAVLLTTSLPLAEAVLTKIKTIVANETTLIEHLAQIENWCKILVLDSLDDCIACCNQLAPEHLEVMLSNAEDILPQLKHYGALFVGQNTPVPIGDYMAGPNHTLPTARSARFSGALTPFAFLRPQTFINVSDDNQGALAKDSATFAALEGLLAHQRSAALRV